MKFVSKLRAATLVSGLTFAASSVFAQGTYSLTDVGTLPSCDRAYPFGLNDAGHVTGQCHNGANGLSQSFVWRNGVISALGKFPSGTYSEASAINDLGTVVGQGDTSSAVMTGWVTTPKGLYNFFSNNGGFTAAMFVGNSGFIGGRYTTSKSGWVAKVTGAIWTPDSKDPRKYRKFDLPILQGGIDPKSSYSHPNAFNHAGQAVGYGQTDQIYRTAVIWNNNAAHTIQTLPFLPDGYGSEAFGINGQGQAVGVHFGAGTLPVMWDNDAARTISALPLLAEDNYGQAVAINNAGHVIGVSGTFVDNATPMIESPVVWRDGGVFEIQSLLDPVSSQGYVITSAVAINNAGQIIANVTLNGQARAVVLTPLVP